MTTHIAVNGATGRMGHAVIETAAEREDTNTVIGFGTEPDGVHGVPVVTEDIAATLDEKKITVVVDFSTPEATHPLAKACVAPGTALVVGTTGFDTDGLRVLDEASKSVPLLKATNFSRGVQALQRIVRKAVRALPDYDLELTESYHKMKDDAPSGTASDLLTVIQTERDVEPVYGRKGHAPRSEDEIGVFAHRAGNIRGKHELVLAGNDERLSLSHQVEDRAVFATGALDAAVWISGRDAGRYQFGDIIDKI